MLAHLKKYATWSHHQTQLPPSTRIQGRKVLVVPANQFSHSRIVTDSDDIYSKRAHYTTLLHYIVTDARMLQIPSNILLTALPTPHGVRTNFGIKAGQNTG